MAEEIQNIDKAIDELRKDENKCKFMQSVDLIINLQNIDIRKESINTFISMPHASDRKICAFLKKKSNAVDTITEEGFARFKDAKEIKGFAKKYDFFIASAPLMGKIATTFGRVFGPMGKMPSPQAGIIMKEDEAAIKQMVEKMKGVVRVRTKEKSIKVSVGKEDLSDNAIKENVDAVLSGLEKSLPRGKENIKNAIIKLTMSKPIKFLDNTTKREE
jgi:large subunit ribosomal protein L1